MTVEAKIYEEDVVEKPEQNHEDTEIISIRTAKLLKMRHTIEKLKKEALSGYSEELKKLKLACNSTNALLGEMNEATGGKQTG